MSSIAAGSHDSFLLLSPSRSHGLNGIFKRQSSKRHRNSINGVRGWIPEDIELIQAFNDIGIETFFRPNSIIAPPKGFVLASSPPRRNNTRVKSTRKSKRCQSSLNINKEVPPTPSIEHNQLLDKQFAQMMAQNRLEALISLINELLNYEQSYIGSLTVLQDGFEIPIRTELCSMRNSRLRNFLHFIKKKRSHQAINTTMNQLFEHFGQLMEIHMCLHDEIKDIQLMCNDFGENSDVYALNCVTMFLGRRLTDLNIYVELVKQQVNAIREFENLVYHSEKFRNVMSRCEKSTGCDFRTLLLDLRKCIWYYIGFVQKVGEFCNAEGNENVESCLQYLMGIYRNMGSHMRQTDSIIDLARLQNSITGLDAPLIKPNVKLLHEGSLAYQSGKQTTTDQVQCWLFTDRMVIARQQCDTLVHEATFFLKQTCLIDSVGLANHQSHTLCLTTKHHRQMAYVHVDSEDQFELWRNAIQYGLRINTERRPTI
ncbi:hypothetical protein BDF19DRAFT_463847 [Syncephalis fuscata]|nr:hypothetical protein BDF19DRAFT_463847 [Syncephalis fuscata]